MHKYRSQRKRLYQFSELLANIRNGTIFEKAKAIVAKVGVGSLAEFGKVAAQLTALHLKELLQHAQ